MKQGMVVHNISECGECGCRGNFDLCPNKCHTNPSPPPAKKYVLTWEEYLGLLSRPEEKMVETLMTKEM